MYQRALRRVCLGGQTDGVCHHDVAVSFGFSTATAAWLERAFAHPTPAQAGAWEAINQGRHTLVVAPTGSGKTLAAFLSALDRLSRTAPDEPLPAEQRCRVVYVSPLKALASDIERNLRAPLVGIEQEHLRTGTYWPGIRVGVRTGDTTHSERAALVRQPPDILITTPESLYLMLTSRARTILRGVDTVIVDEIHAIAGSKRGSHLALTLARLDAWSDKPIQRIGLSATVRPLSAVARWLAPQADAVIVNPPMEKRWDLSVVVPVPDMANLPLSPQDDVTGAPTSLSMWPHVEARVAEVISQHRSTIVFANSRRQTERLTQRLNEPAPTASDTDDTAGNNAALAAMQVVARAHHGSVSKEQRREIEEALKRGELSAVVATSSLELGIDMGAVDVVVQVESPPSVASGLQRVGRAGHHVGAVSRGVMFPKFRGDLVQTAVVVERMRSGLIEELAIPRNALDVLAQQIVAIVAMDDTEPDALFDLARSASGYTDLPRSAFDAVLDMLSGRYAHDEYAELRPRIVWDRITSTLSARSSSQRLAVTNGGTIPDRGLFPVLMVGERNTRVGELDEEMVYESRVGDVFALGTNAWRIEDITHDSVFVSPAPGHVGKLPFWTGDNLGRPLELGRAVGAFVRELDSADADAARTRLSQIGLDAYACDNLLAYIAEQRQAVGAVPTDRTIVVERARDELGDWRIIIHSPFGAAVHAPWSLLISAAFQERFGFDAQVSHADDGVVLRIPDFADEFDTGQLLDCIQFDPDDVEELINSLVSGSALFAARFRECAGRALLLPKRDPRRRAPLWQQRQRAAQLMAIASKYSTFPMLLETMREVTQDVYDVPGLRWLMGALRDEQVLMSECEADTASPFAKSLLYGYVAQFLYEGDNPLAERRAAALTLDAELLTELLGTPDLRELLDPDVIAAVRADLQRLAPERKATSVDQTADLFRLLGPLTREQALDRGAQPDWLTLLIDSRRIIEVRIGGVDRFAAIEDAGRLRDGLGVALPVGIPTAFTDVVVTPLHDLLARWARSRGPFTLSQLCTAWGLASAVATLVADDMLTQRRWRSGQFSADGHEAEFCDVDVVRQLRRRTVAALRKQAEPVPQQAYARFLPVWHGCGHARRGLPGLIATIEQLQGYPIPASALESSVLAHRIIGYLPSLLDELLLSGELAWVGRGGLPGQDGWVSLVPQGATLLPSAAATEFQPDEVQQFILQTVGSAGAWLYTDIEAACRDHGFSVTAKALDAAIWDLVWAGQLTNNSMAALRAYISGSTKTARPRLGTSSRGLIRAATPQRLSGRWLSSAGFHRDDIRTRATTAEQLLHRHAVVTGGAVTTERISGGWSQTFAVLSALEERGRAQRGYVIEGLGGAQFSTAAAIDSVREYAREGVESRSFVLAATDPANPFGAALPWPRHPHLASGHRPGRKVGAFVVLVDGSLALYLERGGKTLLCFSGDDETVRQAATVLVAASQLRVVPAMCIEAVDGASVAGVTSGRSAQIALALESAGFTRSPRGLRAR